jgi:hypothetical protein
MLVIRFCIFSFFQEKIAHYINNNIICLQNQQWLTKLSKKSCSKQYKFNNHALKIFYYYPNGLGKTTEMETITIPTDPKKTTNVNQHSQQTQKKLQM